MKKTYTRPELIDHGSVTAQTLQGTEQAPEDALPVPDKIGLL
jgi:hypothetical protein